MLEVDVLGALPPAPPLVTWNPGDSAPGTAIAYSNGNLTATCLDGFSYVGGRATKSRTASGKFYMEFNVSVANDQNAFGLANSSQGQFHVFLGNSVNGMGLFPTTVPPGIDVFYNNVKQASFTGYTAFSPTSVFQFAIDLTNSLMWANVDNAALWNGSGTANPSTGTGGFSMAGFVFLGGAIFPAFDVSVQFTSILTANFGATPFAFPQPTGFGPW